MQRTPPRISVATCSIGRKALMLALSLLYVPTGINPAFCTLARGNEPSSRDARDEPLRRLAIGTWCDEYQGKRTKTLYEDGTGTMVVELEGLRARLFAARLTFQMVWSIEGGRMKKRTIKGEPAVQVQMILRTMGDRVDEEILELTEDRLLLQDKDGKTQYDWQRQKAESVEDKSSSRSRAPSGTYWGVIRRLAGKSDSPSGQAGWGLGQAGGRV